MAWSIRVISAGPLVPACSPARQAASDSLRRASSLCAAGADCAYTTAGNARAASNTATTTPMKAFPDLRIPDLLGAMTLTSQGESRQEYSCKMATCGKTTFGCPPDEWLGSRSSLHKGCPVRKEISAISHPRKCLDSFKPCAWYLEPMLLP